MMGGWKTWASAIGLILAGLGMIAAGLGSEPMNIELLVAGWASLMLGLGEIGIGHKIEKNKVN